MEKENKKTEIVAAVTEKNMSDLVLNRVKDLQKEGNLQFPVSYSYQNALKSAWLILQETQDRDKNPVLQTCNQTSIMNSLLNMVIQGLSPAKKQCYFIAYGKQLQLSRSYMGTVAVTKRLKAVNDVKAFVIYEKDEFETTYDLDTATLNITKFEPKFENIDNTKIKGAFAVVLGEKGPIYTEIMNIAQIKMAWSKSRTGGQVHKDFAEEMAKKTVINRACKMFANTSDDSDVLIEAFNNTDKEFDPDDTQEAVQTEIKEKANSKVIDTEVHEEKEVIQEAEIIPTDKGKEETKNENEIDF